MRDNPEIVGERVGWLLNGTYGYGQKMMAQRAQSAAHEPQRGSHAYGRCFRVVDTECDGGCGLEEVDEESTSRAGSGGAGRDQERGARGVGT